MEKVVAMILDATGWTFDEVFSKCRTRERVYRRGLIFFILATNHFSLLKIAKYSGKDHTTVLHARRMFENQLETEPLTSTILREIISFICNNAHLY